MPLGQPMFYSFCAIEWLTTDPYLSPDIHTLTLYVSISFSVAHRAIPACVAIARDKSPGQEEWDFTEQQTLKEKREHGLVFLDCEGYAWMRVLVSDGCNSKCAKSVKI